MYPLLLKPAIKDYIWGGTRLKTDWDFKTEAERAAEAWVLSAYKDGAGIVLNGELAGSTLPEVLEKWGSGAVGSRAARQKYFPLLIKLIDARDRLSVQVHPDDEYALKNEGEPGKTEMWYVLDCDEGAELIYGFNRSVTREELSEKIKNNTISEICNYVPVHRGDVFFISAGTLHAIGAGILIAEVQQSSNTTYRVSDYGRLGADGKPRPLHIEKALEVTKCEAPSVPYGNVGKTEITDYGSRRRLAECEFFTSDLIILDGKTRLFREESFISLLVTESSVTLSGGEHTLTAQKGAGVFIPAGLKTELSGRAELLLSYV